MREDCWKLSRYCLECGRCCWWRWGFTAWRAWGCGDGSGQLWLEVCGSVCSIETRCRGNFVRQFLKLATRPQGHLTHTNWQLCSACAILTECEPCSVWCGNTGRDGEIGRRSGLKIRRGESSVGVRFPLPAPGPSTAWYSGRVPGWKEIAREPTRASAQYGYSAFSDARFYSLPSPWSLNCCVVPTKNSSYLRLPAVADSSPLILPQISSAGPESGSACSPCAE